jgi:cytochrome c oxidase subunit 3
LTGLHGLHVTVGVLLLIGLLIRAFLGHFSSHSHFGVEGTVLYWHFVDVVWIALYATLYIL